MEPAFDFELLAFDLEPAFELERPPFDLDEALERDAFDLEAFDLEPAPDLDFALDLDLLFRDLDFDLAYSPCSAK